MDPLERHIADAVNVDPSPEFVARVRARVVVEGVPRRRMSPFFVAVAGMAAAIAVAAWLTRGDRTTAQPTTPVPRQVAEARPAPAKPQMMRATPRVKPAPPQAPQIVIAADEIRGLHQLAALVRDGVVLKFDEPKVDEARVPSVQEIVVAPIHIAPLTMASNTKQEGDEQ